MEEHIHSGSSKDKERVFSSEKDILKKYIFSIYNGITMGASNILIVWKKLKF